MIPPRVILAAVNFSDTAWVALVFAARLAQHCGAELHVLYAEHPLLDAAADHAGIRLGRNTHDELQRFIVGAWPAAQCSPVSHVIAGAPVDVILDVAHQHHADLVVVGRCGMSERKHSCSDRRLKGCCDERTYPSSSRRRNGSRHIPTRWTRPAWDRSSPSLISWMAL